MYVLGACCEITGVRLNCIIPVICKLKSKKNNNAQSFISWVLLFSILYLGTLKLPLVNGSDVANVTMTSL